MTTDGDGMTTDAGKTTGAAASERTALVELDDVSKYYGNIRALEGVSLEVHAGEISCVLGDNGAGKSTLIKIIAGLHQHDAGTLSIEGEETRLTSPREALDRHRHRLPGPRRGPADAGVAELLPRFRAVEGHGPLQAHGRRPHAQDHPRELLRMGIDLRDVDQPIGTLSGGERQCVAIARAVHFGAKVLVLDEPTAALGVKQSGVVLKYVAAARDAGLGVVLITHNPHHAYLVGDRFVLLKRGAMFGSHTRDEISLDGADPPDGGRQRAGRPPTRAGAKRVLRGAGELCVQSHTALRSHTAQGSPGAPAERPGELRGLRHAPPRRGEAESAR